MTENKRKFTIGRARDCDVVLADSSVSRHCSGSLSKGVGTQSGRASIDKLLKELLNGTQPL